MTKDELNRQWQHKKDAVANAEGQLRVAQRNERVFIAENGLEMLGLKNGDIIRRDDGARGVVQGVNLRLGFPVPIALMIKKNGVVGKLHLQVSHYDWMIEKKGTPE